jgi:hypothetical protein
VDATTGEIVQQAEGERGIEDAHLQYAWDCTNPLRDKPQEEQQQDILSRLSDHQQLDQQLYDEIGNPEGTLLLVTAEVDPKTLEPMVTGSGAQRVSKFAEAFMADPNSLDAVLALRQAMVEEGLKVPSVEYITDAMKKMAVSP